jgi:hypothetical protein
MTYDKYRNRFKKVMDRLVYCQYGTTVLQGGKPP